MKFKILAYKKALSFLKNQPFYVNPGCLKSDFYEIDPSGKIIWPGNVFSCKPPVSTEENKQLKNVKVECESWVAQFNIYQESFLKEVIEKTLPSAEVRDTSLVDIKESVIANLLREIKTHIPSNDQETTSYLKRVVDYFTSFSNYIHKASSELAGGELVDEGFDSFKESLLKELENVSMISYKNVHSSLQSDGLDLSYRLKRALNEENPYTKKCDFSSKVNELFDLFFLEKVDLVSKDEEDSESKNDFEITKEDKILKFIIELYELEDIRLHVIEEEQKKLDSLKSKTKQKVILKSKKEILKINNCPENFITFLLKEDLKDVNSMAITIKKELEKCLVEETDRLTNLSVFEMKACNYPQSAKQHVTRINRVYLQLKTKIDKTDELSSILEKIKNEFTVGLFNQLIENFKQVLNSKDVDVSVPKKIDTALNFSFITTFSLNKENVIRFEKAQHSEIWLDNLETFMRDCTTFVAPNIMSLNTKAMLWIFAVDDWVEDQVDLMMVKRAVTQLFNIMHGYLFEEEKEAFSDLLNDYKINQEVIDTFPDKNLDFSDPNPDDVISKEFEAFKKSLDDICSNIANEFSGLNGHDFESNKDKVRYSDFMRQMQGYLKAVLQECSYNLAEITLDKQAFYAQRMDTSGCNVFSIMSILASGSSIKRSSLDFWRENKIEYYMNLLTSLSNGVIFSSVKEHTTYNWKHNDIYVVLVNNLKGRLDNAINFFYEKFPDAIGMPKNIIEEVVKNLNNKLNEIKYNFSEEYEATSKEVLLNRILSNKAIMQSELEKAIKELYKDINECSKNLFKTLPAIYEYDFDKMVCLAAIWQWVDGGWIAQALAPRYKNSNQQFMLKDKFNDFCKDHNLFDFLTTKNSFIKDLVSDPLTYNEQLSHSRKVIYDMTKNSNNNYDSIAIGTLVNCISKYYSQMFIDREECSYEPNSFSIKPHAKKILKDLRGLSSEDKNLGSLESMWPVFFNGKRDIVGAATEIVQFLHEEFNVTDEQLNSILFRFNTSNTAEAAIFGVWKDASLIKGKIEMYNEDEFEIYDGEFKAGLYSGNGVLQIGNSCESTREDGEFELGKFKTGCFETNYEDYLFSVTKKAKDFKDGKFQGPGTISVQLNGNWDSNQFNSNPFSEDIDNIIEKLMKRASFDYSDSDSR